MILESLIRLFPGYPREHILFCVCISLLITPGKFLDITYGSKEKEAKGIVIAFEDFCLFKSSGLFF